MTGIYYTGRKPVDLHVIDDFLLNECWRICVGIRTRTQSRKLKAETNMYIMRSYRIRIEMDNSETVFKHRSKMSNLKLYCPP
jgi:hypothetical protein